MGIIGRFHRNYTQHSAWHGEARAIGVLVGPLALSHLAATAIGATDIVMMGWLGPGQLAAGSLAGSYYALFHYLGLGIVTACAPLFAQALGARRLGDVRRTAQQGLWISLAVSFPFGLAIWHSGAFLALIGQPPEMAALGEAYTRAAVWGFAPAMGLAVLRGFVAAHARPRPALVVTLLGVAVNALGNYALMFGKFGFPALGVVGCGIASAMVNGFMFLALLGYVLRDRRYRRYRLLARLGRPDWHLFREIFAIGTPIGLSNLGEMGSFIAATFLIGLFGTTALAAHAIALECASIAFAIPLAISQAATVRVGRAAGAGDSAGVRRAGWTAIAIGAVFGGALALAFWQFGRPIAGLFLDPGGVDTDTVADLAATYLVLAGLFQLVDGPQAGASGALRGLKDTRVPMAIVLISFWVIGAAACVLLGFGLGFRGVGVWSGLALALALASALLIRRFYRRCNSVVAEVEGAVSRHDMADRR